MHHPTDRITHTTAFVTTVVEYWLEREIGKIGIPDDALCTLCKEDEETLAGALAGTRNS